MLRKLIKHEWKDVSKVGGLLLLVMLAVTVIGCIVIKVSAIGDLFLNEKVDNMRAIGTVYTVFSSAIIYVLMLVGISYGIFIYLGVRFYKTMYTSQGYLLHTLPVTKHQILFSKILVSGIWYFFISAAIVLSVCSLLYVAFSGILTETLSKEGYTLMELVRIFLREMTAVYEEEMGLDMTRYVVTMVIVILLSPFTNLMLLFGGITLGQLSQKHKGLMGVLAYFGLLLINMVVVMVVQTVTTLHQTIVLMQSQEGVVSMNMNLSYDINALISIVMGAVMYVVSYLVITRKLNLD